ncbi:hypothetical protein GCM10010531_38920 [Blastococcus jejuensis]|uniref:Sulfotransferase family protein n=1 Tax=Blastococcus jejuensis TaxID=351224 RepID=A0ABP6PMI2_9ACTN
MYSSDARSGSVFIIGCGRSGTTLLYELLATHPGFAWPSTWTDRTLRPSLAALNGAFRWSRRGSTSHRGVPRPSEGYRLWDAALGPRQGAADGVLGSADVDEEQARKSRDMADAHRRWSRGAVFLNKNTRNTRRVAALSAIFPDATFIHVLRSPLDVVSSLLAVSWWKDLPLWTRAGEQPGVRSAVEQASMAGELWTREVEVACDSATRLDPDRYFEVRYEQLLQNPRDVVSMTLDRLGLTMSRSTERAVGGLTVLQRRGTYRSRLTLEQQSAAWETASSTARAHGYASDSPSL